MPHLRGACVVTCFTLQHPPTHIQAKGKLGTGTRIGGLVVAKDFAYTIMDPRYELLRWQKGWCLTLFCCCPGCARCALCSDVETFTQLTTHQVKQTMHIPFFQVCALLTVSHRARCLLTRVLLPQSFTVLDQFLRAMYEDVRKVCACALCACGAGAARVLNTCSRLLPEAPRPSLCWWLTRCA